MTALLSLILAVSLLLGGGVTVAAAQDDLPNQSLYQLKLWTENATLAMTADPQKQAEQLMTMAQTRVEEIAALAEMGTTPPDQVRERLETHLHQTLMLAADMDEAALEGTLMQLRDRLRTQDQLMQQVQSHAGTEIERLLSTTRQMLQFHLQLAEQGLADPQGFRHMMKNVIQFGPEVEATPAPNQQGEPGFHHNNPTAQPGGEPGAGNGNGNQAGNGDTPGGPNPEEPQSGNSGNEEPGGPNPDKPQEGNGESGSGNGEPEGQNPDGPQGGSESEGGNGGGNGAGGDGGKK